MKRKSNEGLEILIRGYLQRLAERAEGVTATPPLMPVQRREVDRGPGSESLFEEPVSEFAELLTSSNDIPGNRPAQQSSTNVEPSTQTLPQVRSQPQELSKPAEAPQEVGVMVDSTTQTLPRVRSQSKELSKPAAAQRNDGVTAEPAPPSSSRVWPRREELNVVAEAPPEPATVTGPRSKRNESIEPSVLSPLKERDLSEKVVIEASPTVEKEPTLLVAAHRAARNEEISRQILPTAQPVERTDHSLKKVEAIAAGETPAPSLEPRPAAPSRVSPSTSDEPRLVIGQLRVDVLPAVPVQARAAGEGGQRRARVGATTHRSHTVSKLRFGLGQM